MVTFKLIEETDTLLVYYYFPEGKENKKPGIIIIDRITDEINISELAEDDSERDISPEELNGMAERINQMERERGGTNFVEMVTEPVHRVFYGDHAVRRITESLKKGQIQKKECSLVLMITTMQRLIDIRLLSVGVLLGDDTLKSALLGDETQKNTVIWIQITVFFNEVAPCGADDLWGGFVLSNYDSAAENGAINTRRNRR